MEYRKFAKIIANAIISILILFILWSVGIIQQYVVFTIGFTTGAIWMDGFNKAYVIDYVLFGLMWPATFLISYICDRFGW